MKNEIKIIKILNKQPEGFIIGILDDIKKNYKY